MKKIRIVLVVVVTLFLFSLVTGCGKIHLQEPQNIKYDGNTITWDEVESADYYVISINGGQEYEVSTNKYPYSSTSAEFSVTVKASSNIKKIINSGVRTTVFKQLDKIEEIRVSENGELSWNAINNASGYKMMIDGVELNEVIYGAYYSKLSTGNHSIQVKAVVENNNEYFATWSNVKNINILGTISKDSIRYENSKIVWDYVSGAKCYEITINGNVVSSNCTTTSYSYLADNNNFEVNVRAIGNGATTFNGAISETKKFVYLDTVTNIFVEDGILRWDEVNGADGYKIEVDGVVQSEILKKCEYSKITSSINTPIRLLPIANDKTYFSSWSDRIDLYLLATPIIQWQYGYGTDIKVTNSISWNAVNGAVNYTVRITDPTGNVIEKNTVLNVFGENEEYGYNLVGTYKIELKANASPAEGDNYDSKYSQPIYVTRLEAPKPFEQNYIVSDATDLNKGFTVTFEKVSQATSYQLYKDNNPIMNSVGNQFKVNDITDLKNSEEQRINYKIQSIGSITTMNGCTHAILNSLSNESLSFEIVVLAAPKNLEMSGYTLSFGTVNNANDYVINIDGESIITGVPKRNLDIIGVGRHNVKVCTKGNGANILPSPYSPNLLIERLVAPTNVTIDQEVDEGKLNFDNKSPDSKCKGYSVFIDNNTEAIPAEDKVNMNKYISEQGTAIIVIASANEYSEDKTIYYMSSPASETFTFIKLAAPTFGDKAFNNNQLVWLAPANINTSVYTPTYEVCFTNGQNVPGVKNGTSLDISELEGGKKYEFYVRAIGDSKKYVNSDFDKDTTPIAKIFKLASPEVKCEKNGYTWKNVVNASNYEVWVEGKLVQEYASKPGETYTYIPNFEELKKYNVSIYAIGDGGYTTINSSPTTIWQEIRQLETPDFCVGYSGQHYELNGTIDVTITKTSSNATGYAYVIGGTKNLSENEKYSFNPNTTGTFDISVYALAGFGEDGIYYLNSQPRSGSDKSITLLSKPTQDSIKMTIDGHISWGSVFKAVKYEVEIIVNDISRGVATTTNASYIIDNLAKGDKVVIKIRAIGNGKNIISSEVVEKEYNNII